MNRYAKILEFTKNKYTKNTGWLFAERIIRVAVNFFVTIYLVKYLGPDNFGLLSYALSYVALFTSIASLGLDNLIVRDLVTDPDKKDVVLGTSVYLKLLASGFTIVLLALVLTATREEPFSIFLILVVGSSMVFQSLNIIDFYFQSQLHSRFTVVSQSGSLLFASAIRIALIILKADLIYFAGVVALEALFLSVGLFAFYKKVFPGKLKWNYSSSVAKTLLRQAFPLLLSGIVISVYMKIDQIMVKKMLNNSEAGFYAAAVKVCELWYFIPMAISASLFPAVINARKGGEALFNKRLQQLYDIMVWLSVGIALPLTFFAPQVIHILFGDKYAQASAVLQIYIWSGVATFLGVASSQFLVAENFTKISFYRTLAGMISNLLLNFYLIPRVGIVGAAYATLISYSLATFSIVFFKKTKHQGRMMLRSLFFISLIDYQKKIVERKV